VRDLGPAPFLYLYGFQAGFGVDPRYDVRGEGCMRPGFVAFALAALIGASTASAECLKANQNGEIAEGILSLGTFEDANDRPEKAYILALPAPVCLSGADDIDKVSSADTIHVYSSDEAVAQSLKQLVGKKVKVKGNAFGAITAHHHAPIVMEISEIEAD
jgi:Domain of unknown function (DUF4431)